MLVIGWWNCFVTHALVFFPPAFLYSTCEFRHRSCHHRKHKQCIKETKIYNILIDFGVGQLLSTNGMIDSFEIAFDFFFFFVSLLFICVVAADETLFTYCDSCFLLLFLLSVDIVVAFFALRIMLLEFMILYYLWTVFSVIFYGSNCLALVVLAKTNR